MRLARHWGYANDFTDRGEGEIIDTHLPGSKQQSAGLQRTSYITVSEKELTVGKTFVASPRTRIYVGFTRCSLRAILTHRTCSNTLTNLSVDRLRLNIAERFFFWNYLEVIMTGGGEDPENPSDSLGFPWIIFVFVVVNYQGRGLQKKLTNPFKTFKFVWFIWNYIFFKYRLSLTFSVHFIHYNGIHSMTTVNQFIHNKYFPLSLNFIILYIRRGLFYVLTCLLLPSVVKET